MRKRKPNLFMEIPETEDSGRSRRQSTKLVSAATLSVLRQSTIPAIISSTDDTHEKEINCTENKIETKARDITDTSQQITVQKPKKTMNGSKKVKLPTQTNTEETVDEKRAESSEIKQEKSGKKRGRKPKVMSAINLKESRTVVEKENPAEIKIVKIGKKRGRKPKTKNNLIEGGVGDCNRKIDTSEDIERITDKEDEVNSDGAYNQGKKKADMESCGTLDVKSETKNPSYKNFTFIDQSNIIMSGRKSRNIVKAEEVPPFKEVIVKSNTMAISSVKSQVIESIERTEMQDVHGKISKEQKNIPSNKKYLKESSKRGRGRPRKSPSHEVELNTTGILKGRKRKREKQHNIDSKKLKSLITQRPCNFQLKEVEETDLTIEPMKDSLSPVRRSGRDSTRICTIATMNAKVSSSIPKCQQHESINKEKEISMNISDQDSHSTYSNAKINEILKESPDVKRSRRSTTAISTLATSQFVAQERNKKVLEVKDEFSENKEEQLPSPLVPSKRGRGRPKKTLAGNKISDNTILTNQHEEDSISAGKNNTQRKTQCDPKKLSKKPMASKATNGQTPKLKSGPNRKSKTPTAAENDRLFDALLQGKPSLPAEKTVEKEKKNIISSSEQTHKTLKEACSVTKVPFMNPQTTNINIQTTNLNLQTTNINKTPRVIAPWRHLNEVDQPENSDDKTATDVYEFSGFPDDPPSQNEEPVLRITRRKSQEKQKTQDTIFGRPSRVKLFMVAPHGAYSGFATGIKRKMEQTPSKAQSQSPLRSPMRSPMRSPIRAGLGSPRGETYQHRSPRVGFGSPRSSPSERLGSPRIDPSQRIGSPKIDRANSYPSPPVRLGGSPHQRVGGSPKASPKTAHGILLVDVPADKPGISLTGLASDYNIVAAVDKHHTPSVSVGQLPQETIDTMENPINLKIESAKSHTNGQYSSNDVGIAASNATIVHNSDGTVSVVSKDISKTPDVNNCTETAASEQVNTSKKSVLLSRIFSKPPIKEGNEVEPKHKAEDKNDFKSLKAEDNLISKDKSLLIGSGLQVDSDYFEGNHCNDSVDTKINKTRNKKYSKHKKVLTECPQSIDKLSEASVNTLRKPSRNASKKIQSMKEFSSDSESNDSYESEDLATQPYVLPKKFTKGKYKKLGQPKSISSEWDPSPKMNSPQTNLHNSQNKAKTGSSSTISKRGKSGRGITPIASCNIVCTSCHKDDINLVKQLVNKFGTFSFSTSVTSSTSHVVSGEGKRTLNLLKGLLQGCWIVTKDWVLSSLEKGKWVDEEPFEMVDFSPAVRNVRQEKGAFQGAFKSELFKDIGNVFISSSCKAPTEELKQLILSGGGSVSNVTSSASVVVGETSPEFDNADCVTEKWILDSVQYHVIMPFSDYPTD